MSKKRTWSQRDIEGYATRVFRTEKREHEFTVAFIDDKNEFDNGILHWFKDNKKNMEFVVIDCKGVDLGRNRSLDILICMVFDMIFVFDLKSLGHDRLSRLPFWKSEKVQKIFWDCAQDTDALVDYVQIANPISDMSIMYHRWFEKERFDSIEAAAKALDLFHQPFNIEYNSRECAIKIDAQKEWMNSVWRKHPDRKGIWDKRPLNDRYIQYSAVNTMLTWRIYTFFTKVRKSDLGNQEFIDVNQKYSVAHARKYQHAQASKERIDKSKTPLLLRLPHTHVLLEYEPVDA